MEKQRPYDIQKSFISFKLHDGTEIRKLSKTTIKKGEYQINSIIKLDDSDDVFIIKNIEINYARIVSVMKNADDIYTYTANETYYETLHESDICFDINGNIDLTVKDNNYAGRSSYTNNYYAVQITVDLDYERHKNGIESDKKFAKLALIFKRSIFISLANMLLAMLFRNPVFVYLFIFFLIFVLLFLFIIVVFYKYIPYKPYTHTTLVKTKYYNS